MALFESKGLFSEENVFKTISSGDFAGQAAPAPLSFVEEPVFRSLDFVMPSLTPSRAVSWGDETDVVRSFGPNVMSLKSDLFVPKGLNDLPVTGSDGIALQQALVVHPVPEYFERYSSFYSSCHPPQIFSAIVEVFASQGIDFSISSTSYKIQAVVYEDNSQIKFEFFVYQSEKLFLVEFQRLKGSGLSFSSFFRRLVRVQSISSLIDYPASAALSTFFCQPVSESTSNPSSAMSSIPPGLAIPSFGGAVPPPLSLETDVMTLTQDCFESLSQMIESLDIESQSQAVRIFANATFTSIVNRQFLLKEIVRLLRLLELALTSSWSESQRCGCQLLLNLLPSAQPSVKVQLLDRLVMLLSDILTSRPSLTNRETKRLAAQCLENFTLTHAPTVMTRLSVSAVKSVDTGTDLRLKSSLDSLADSLLSLSLTRSNSKPTTPHKLSSPSNQPLSKFPSPSRKGRHSC